MPSPVLTVIMPVYNAEKYVYEAIDSILKQTFTDFEFLIFNDCSTDASRDIILSFKDPRIRLIDSPVNTGYVKHLNEGLKLARGKYIARMDADDVATADRFVIQVDFLDLQREVAACGSWIEFIGDKEGVLKYPVIHNDIVTQLFLSGNAMAHPSVMLRRSTLIAHQLFYNIGFEPAEDYDLWNRISEIAHLHNIPEVLLKYRWHSQNESIVKKSKQDRLVRQIREQVIQEKLPGASFLTLSFFLGDSPEAVVGNRDLRHIRAAVIHAMNSGNFNNQKLKEVLNNRFISWCQLASISGWHKMMHYMRFPKLFYSYRICLSLLIKK